MSDKVLMILMAMIFVPTWVLAMAYIFVLGRFFKEVKEREPALWQSIGRPGLLDMICLPFLRFHKYTNFLPHLIARKDDPSLGYRWARPTYYLLVSGLLMFCLLVAVLLVLAISGAS